ncbi:MAG: undecaprenyldiphospho-muramoylpentapeptide beta-N-acetylglucosaminyltransferase [Ignavibacteriales bacterium UTCHB2]|jgi:UDP-N-acetylglucosamine--N-acetylmuramyl-(pentapeptide) pyrophosphoryl-undecaprenol N-acetylglucosamine transferase|nr:MAG: UDP-N-acetylglucosamine--N-acetylmuramyl-(pentapeptide) pyrophosphoryl-undecaprenol N-acetylglucosamine transferase [Ignavibacteria bacterium ADurb.Bin266]OQY70403.1 MAG: undecaprenyldiphospho-muramoylpentapeptide beta-N-acetylglucosaminyltransferase [Ignavibacteriales bacterium UTCHB2]HQI39641.1 undecaprenyldiphospho-muramoylpentapeptide beta-N-acetylglucosaminyltransferase [Ignavibacteriaceae bacterium]
MKSITPYRFLFAGGGTGGHLYPAIAVANEIKKIKPESEIIFVGSKSKIEGKVVPKLGYGFKSIWIKGFARKFNFENILFPIKLFVSLIQSLIISFRFKPRVAIGSGGYVAGPAIWGASVLGAKIILMESNSYPGITTRLLERYADELHVAFEDSKKYLRKPDIIKVTGNPVRTELGSTTKEEAKKYFGLDENKKTILVLGGSLGAASINETIADCVEELEKKSLQIIWQTGKNYYHNYKNINFGSVKILDFIEDMDKAYSACDVLVARAGATTIAELTVLGIASILIPSPHVAENHQYYNAKSLSDNNAAVLIQDSDVKKILKDEIIKIAGDEKLLKSLSENAKKLSKPEAANTIAKSAINYALSV